MQTSPEVQNRGISGLTKRSYVSNFFFLSKKVLLRGRKRHTACFVASAHYAAVSNGWGVPHPVLEPPTIQTWPKGVPPYHPDMACGGTPGYPHHPDLVGGGPPPTRPGMGYPPTQTWDWVPPNLGWGTPHPQT